MQEDIGYTFGDLLPVPSYPNGRRCGQGHEVAKETPKLLDFLFVFSHHLYAAVGREP
jgi:hypothetical protein